MPRRLFFADRLGLSILLSNLVEDFSFQLPKLGLLCCREVNPLPRFLSPDGDQSSPVTFPTILSKRSLHGL